MLTAAQIRKKIHDRAFACDEAADEELQANGKTDIWQTLREEAQWLHALLIDIDNTSK